MLRFYGEHIQGSENREKLIEVLGLTTYMDADRDDEVERILEVLFVWDSMRFWEFTDVLGQVFTCSLVSESGCAEAFKWLSKRL